MPRLFFSGIINRWRREVLGLEKVGLSLPAGSPGDGPLTQLCAASPAMVPYADSRESGFVNTGYWFLEEGKNWQPDSELTRFLKAGPAPIYIGFGSMPSKNPARLSRRVLKGVLSGPLTLLPKMPTDFPSKRSLNSA